MRRKTHEGGHENHDRWLLTYADMITLLMAFFIMMYSMSVLNLSKFREAAISIRSGFGGAVAGQGKSILGLGSAYSVRPSPIQQGEMVKATWGLIRPLQRYIQKDPSFSKNVSIKMDTKGGVVITLLSDNSLFDSGSAEIRAKAYPLLDKVAEMLDKTANSIRIEGHTCDLPPRSAAKFPTNWELSTARATNVLRFFTERKGLNAKQFSASGYADQHPLVPNVTDDNRRRNRRVEIRIVAGEAPVEDISKLNIKPIAKPIVPIGPDEIRRRAN